MDLFNISQTFNRSIGTGVQDMCKPIYIAENACHLVITALHVGHYPLLLSLHGFVDMQLTFSASQRQVSFGHL